MPALPLAKRYRHVLVVAAVLLITSVAGLIAALRPDPPAGPALMFVPIRTASPVAPAPDPAPSATAAVSSPSSSPSRSRSKASRSPSARPAPSSASPSPARAATFEALYAAGSGRGQSSFIAVVTVRNTGKAAARWTVTLNYPAAVRLIDGTATQRGPARITLTGGPTVPGETGVVTFRATHDSRGSITPTCTITTGSCSAPRRR